VDLDGAAGGRAVLDRQVRAEDDDVTRVIRCQHSPGRELQLEAVSAVRPRDKADDHLRDGEVRARAVDIPEDLDLRVDRGDAVQCGDGIHRFQAHRRGAERLAVGDHDLAGVELAAAADKGVDLVGHRAEDDKRPDADGDAKDGESGPQLAPRELAKQRHGWSFLTSG
jgi:hypothetical protein